MLSVELTEPDAPTAFTDKFSAPSWYAVDAIAVGAVYTPLVSIILWRSHVFLTARAEVVSIVSRIGPVL